MSSVAGVPYRMKLRRKRASDEVTIATISLEAFSEYSANAGSGTVAMCDERGALSFVAVVDDEVCGFAVLKLTGGSEGHLLAIAVAAPARGRGIGTRLLHGVIDAAAANGVRVLRLVTAEANLGALEVFLAAGFSIEHREPAYYPRGQDAVSMQLPITR